jgi:hypothetical protein
MVKPLIIIALLIHSFVTVTAFAEHGFLGFFPPFLQTNTTQIFSDLVLSLTLVNVWIYFDLKHLNKPALWFLPVLIGTALLGSFVPLGYLLLRDKLKNAPQETGPANSVQGLPPSAGA